MAAAKPCTLPETVGAVILAGGRGRRFGGRDKGLLELSGQPLVTWVMQRLRPQVATIVLNANRNGADYATWAEVVADLIPGQPGPLAGIHAACAVLSTEWVLATPCDTPFLPADLVEQLHSGARRAGVDAVYAVDAKQAHYGVVLLRRALANDIPTFLAQGGRRVQDWLARQQARPVLLRAPAQALFNVNTPQDLALAERLVMDEMRQRSAESQP